MNNWIKIYSELLNWEWYKDNNTKSLFIHCLLKANWKDGKFMGEVIPRGSFVTSLEILSKELGLTIQQTRTSLKHLISTGELTNKSNNKYRIITINNYEKYQPITSKITDNQQTTNKQVNNQLTTIEDIYIYLTSYLERIYTRALSSLEIEKIKSWINDFDYKVILRAIDISVMNNAKNFNYVEGILKNWKTTGLKTIEDILEEEKRIQNAKEKLNKKIETEKPVKELFDYDWLNETE